MSLISEQVDALRRKAKMFDDEPGVSNTLNFAVDIIEELSAKLASANKERSEQHYDNDYVKVVRCKDCIQWGAYKVLGETERTKCCGYGHYFVDKNGYCVYGEKK